MIGTPGLGFGKYYKYMLAWDIVEKEELRELIANIKYQTAIKNFKSGLKIPTGMTLQKSLTKTGGQMYFKSSDGKKKSKVLNTKKTKKRVKKGSDNLMTFGIRMADVRTLEDMVK